MEYFAHSGVATNRSDWQRLDEHALAVARLAAKFAVPIGLERAAYLAGLLHDLGKYTPAFQARLRGSSERVDHSTAGAAHVVDLAKKASNDWLVAQLAARDIIAAAKVQRQEHHAALPTIVLGKGPARLACWRPCYRANPRKSKGDGDGGLRALSDGECGIVVSRERAERVVGILDALFRALDGDGLDPHPLGKQMRATRGPDQVTFGIIERSKRVPHQPTPAEIAAEERRLKRREWQSGSRVELAFDLFSKAYPDFDTVWTGELVLQVEGWDRGIRRSWADGKTQTLKALLPGIVAGMKVLLATRAVERERRAEDEKRRAELARRRDLAQKRQERLKKRLDYLQIVMSRQDEVIKIRKLLDRLPSTEATGDVDRFKGWARERLAEIETKLTATAMQAEI